MQLIKQDQKINKFALFCHTLTGAGFYYVLVVLVFAPMLFSGCATQQHFIDPNSASFRVLPDKYRQKALGYEKKGLFPEAVQCWTIVLGLSPGDLEIRQKIKVLNERSRNVANKHYKKGVAYYKKGRLTQARREFLLTLAYDQNHESALDYLKKKLQRPVLKNYIVREGDTLSKIAIRELHDSKKAVVIERLNDVDSSKALTPGTLLKIPLLSEGFLNSENVALGSNMIRSAMQTNDKKKERTAVSGINEAASDTYVYNQAKKHLELHEYQKSLQLLRSLDINFRDVRKLITATENLLDEKADSHYRKGINYFLSEELDMAIAEWEEVLRLDPTHQKAKKDLQNARNLQQRVNAD